MWFTSSLRPNAVTSASLLVIQHDEEKVLVRVAGGGNVLEELTFEKLQVFVRRRWSLPAKGTRIAFEMDELAELPGIKVEIDESAWPEIKNNLGRVYVVSKPVNVEIAQEENASAEENEVLNQLGAEEGNDEGNGEYAESHHGESDDEEEKPDVFVRTGSGRSDYVVINPKGEPASPFQRTPMAKEAAREKADRPAPVHVNQTVDPLRLFSDMYSNDPTSAPSVTTSQTGSAFGGEVSSEERDMSEHDEQEDYEHDDHTQPPSRSYSPVTSSEPPPSAFTENSSRFDFDEKPTTIRRTLQRAVSRDTSPMTSQSQSQSQSQTPSQGNDQVLIYVEVPSAGRTAAFRVRSKHTVEKVLKGACRNLKLPFDRSTLYMIVVDDDEEEQRIHCNPEDTMQSLDLLDEQRFVVEVNNFQPAVI